MVPWRYGIIWEEYRTYLEFVSGKKNFKFVSKADNVNVTEIALFAKEWLLFSKN